MKKILINGFLGKMGQSVSEAIENSVTHEPVYYVDLNLKTTPNSSNNFENISKEIIGEIDCIVDFTNSKGFAESSMFAMKNNIPYVSGSTGYSNDDLEKIKNLQSKNKVGVALCSNFSTGAILLAHFGKIASKYYDYAELIESHHENKLDAPSGTAISIADAVSNSKSESFKKVISSINKIKNTRGNDSAGVNIHSLRLPGVIARHELIFGAKGENLSILHNSSDRESFMPGILLAIDYVIKNKNFTIGLDKILGL
tara:strand:+ start:1571 stop:2338 length:768 start_codon:yes stop_codon:yes gene_type:complete